MIPFSPTRRLATAVLVSSVLWLAPIAWFGLSPAVYALIALALGCLVDMVLVPGRRSVRPSGRSRPERTRCMPAGPPHRLRTAEEDTAAGAADTAAGGSGRTAAPVMGCRGSFFILYS